MRGEVFDVGWSVFSYVLTLKGNQPDDEVAMA